MLNGLFEGACPCWWRCGNRSLTSVGSSGVAVQQPLWHLNRNVLSCALKSASFLVVVFPFFLNMEWGGKGWMCHRNIVLSAAWGPVAAGAGVDLGVQGAWPCWACWWPAWRLSLGPPLACITSKGPWTRSICCLRVAGAGQGFARMSRALVAEGRMTQNHVVFAQPYWKKMRWLPI